MEKKHTIFLTIFVAFCFLLSFSIVGATTISNKSGATSYDSINDMYYIADGSEAADDLNAYSDMNRTEYWEFEQGILRFNHTVRQNFTHYLAHDEEMGMNQTTLAFYYFPNQTLFESGEANCTVFRHWVNRNSTSWMTNRTFVYYLNYTDYLTFDWYSNHSSAIAQRSCVVNQSIQVNAYDDTTVYTDLSEEYFDLDNTADDDEQVIAYSVSGEGEDAGEFSTIDFWPETTEQGTGYNPLSQASDAIGGGFTTLYNTFYGDSNESNGDTDTSTGGSSSNDDSDDLILPETTHENVFDLVILIVGIVIILALLFIIYRIK